MVVQDQWSEKEEARSLDRLKRKPNFYYHVADDGGITMASSTEADSDGAIPGFT